MNATGWNQRNWCKNDRLNFWFQRIMSDLTEYCRWSISRSRNNFPPHVGTSRVPYPFPAETKREKRRDTKPKNTSNWPIESNQIELVSNTLDQSASLPTRHLTLVTRTKEALTQDDMTWYDSDDAIMSMVVISPTNFSSRIHPPTHTHTRTHGRSNCSNCSNCRELSSLL